MLSCVLIAAILPADDDVVGLEANGSWRIIFGLPLVSYTLILVGLVFLVPYDSPKFYVASLRRSEAVKSIHRVYKTGGSDDNAWRIYHHVAQNSATETVDASLVEAFVTDEMHRRASWVAVAIIFFSELTGFQAIVLYSNIIFADILGPDAKITPRQGTYIIAAVNFVASIASIATVRAFGRRPLLIFGHVGVAVCHGLLGLFIVSGHGLAVLITMCLFMIIYQNTCEPVGQVYVTEVCSDIALGISTQVLWLVIFVESLITETLMKSSLTPQGVFFVCSCLSVVAAVWEYFYVAETKGCSEREKKSLYIPGARFGRKLGPGERATHLERSVSPRGIHEYSPSDKKSLQHSTAAAYSDARFSTDSYTS